MMPTVESALYGIDPADHAIVIQVAERIVEVRRIQADRNVGNRGLSAMSPDAMIKAYTDDWLHQLRLMEAASDYTLATGMVTGNLYGYTAA
jgi:hypothetical protein